jgi:hypothetical protein
LVVAGQPTQVQTWEKWRKVITLQVSQGLKRKKGRRAGKNPRAGRKTPKG